LFVGHFKIDTGEDGGTWDLETPFKFAGCDEFRAVLVGISLWIPFAVACFPIKNTRMGAIGHATEKTIVWKGIHVGLDRLEI
jgi:hypothetical protein